MMSPPAVFAKDVTSARNSRLSSSTLIGLLVMAHTHRPALTEPFPGRRYLNPGAWIEGRCYAVASGDGVELKQW